MTAYTWALRVYYEDTDLAGIVYYANYLRYMERARSEWLRALGCEQDELLEQANAVFVVVRASLEYKAPARFNDVLAVKVEVTSLGRASVVVQQDVYRAPNATAPGPLLPTSPLNEHVCGGEIRLACVHAKTLYPRPIPESIYTELSREC